MPRRRPPRPYDPAIGRRIVARIRGGEMLRDLWRDPSLPGRFTLKRWRAEVPAFSRAVRAAVNAARSRRYFDKSPYDHAALKAEICRRLQAGQPLRQIMREPGMPNMWTVRRLLEIDEDFQWDLAAARELMLEARVVTLPRDPRTGELRFVVRGKLDLRLMPQRYGVDILIEVRRLRRRIAEAVTRSRSPPRSGEETT